LRRSARLAAALLCSIAALLAGATSSPAQTAGGTSQGSVSGGASPAATAPVKQRTRATSSPHVLSVRITSVSCVPSAKCSGNPHQVSTHGTLLIAGKGLAAGSTIAFPHTPGGRIVRSSPVSHLRRTRAGLMLTVPSSAHSGRIQVLLSHARHSSSYGPIYIYKHALHPPVKPKPLPATVGAVSGSAFDGQGMWIWYVSKSNAGNVASIVAQAHAAGVSTLFIKSSDGSSNYWSQFSPQLVAELHANGLRACAWQYVYGTNPAGEANLGAEAVANGADCLVIDAEAQYEGRYAQASTYVARLRRMVGREYPIGLAGFPYVHYHPAFPYSVFLGPGGAEFNLPQMYWRAIGVGVSKVFSITYTYNGVYERPIFPLGQLYMNPPQRQIVRFRRLAASYGATGVSWWSWQDATARGWRAASKRVARRGPRKTAPYPKLSQGAASDLVVWAQEHLASGGYYRKAVSGRYRSSTQRAVASFQESAGLRATGVLDSETWTALLAELDPEPVKWRRRMSTAGAHARPTGRRTAPRPWSARLPARENELEPGSRD
jgi:Putative peptidoglycan binding domain